MSTRVLIGDLSKMSTLLANDPQYEKVGKSYWNEFNMPHVPDALAAVVRHYRAAVETVNGAKDYSDSWKQGQRHALKLWATGEIQQLNDRFKRAIDAHMAKFPAPSTQVDESKAMRVWSRLQRQLDAGVELGDVVNNANAEELQILTEELGAHYRATIADERVAKFHTESARQLIDQRRAAIDPVAAKQIESRREAEQGIRNVEGAFNYADHAIENDYVGELLGYAPRSTVSI